MAADPVARRCTADALKAALIAAKSVAYSQDASGRHFVSMISRLKLANTLGPKSIIVQDKAVAAAVAAGEAEIGVQQIAELLPVPGIDIVGPLPGDMQKAKRSAKRSRRKASRTKSTKTRDLACHGRAD